MGGTFDTEIISLSVPDLFVMDRRGFKQLLPVYRHHYQTEHDETPPLKSQQQHQQSKLSDESAQYQRARQALTENNYTCAFSELQKVKGRPGGSFEYLADLTLFFTVGRLHTWNSTRMGSDRTKMDNRCLLTKQEMARQSGRVLHYLDAKKRLFGQTDACISRATEHYSLTSELNTEAGVFTGTFIPRNVSADVNDSGFGFRTLPSHQRQWFASDVSGLIVGELSCTREEGGCLNVGLDLSRESSQDFIVVSNLTKVSEREIELGQSLGPSAAMQVAHTYTCMTVQCHGRWASVRTIGEDNKGTVACEGADRATILISVEKQDTLHGAEMAQAQQDNVYFDPTVMQRLSNSCWLRLRSATSTYHTTSQHQLAHSKSISLKASRTVLELFDPKLSRLPAMFRMSRYLMLSAASKSVVNLQGLWGDGRKSEWSGDYHLNINLQMHYWPTFSAGLDEVEAPLVQFLRKLRLRGEHAARSSYGARGWVAHGYVDGFLDTRMPSGESIIWSDCISCGAWAALALWEDFCYTGNLTLLQHELLPSFRGIAEFFTDHMTTLPGHGDTLFTGPSHSPETSYFVNKTGHTVAFSPAIDLAVLRQVANAYYLGATLLGASVTAHVVLATAFIDLVKRTTSGGLPTVDGEQGFVLEFPQPFPAARRNVAVSESEDPGHRHFSSLLWLYPGHFLPSNPVSQVLDPASTTADTATVDFLSAAQHTLVEKISHGGGHTGWSAAWEACLWARLGDGARAGTALDKLLDRFTSAKFFGLHPPLRPSSTKDCRTCFEIRPRNCNSPQCGLFGRGQGTRGLKEEDDSLLQLDANSGFLAAVVEMCVQSHVPGYISLLPAIPPSWVSSGGYVRGLKARGRVQVSIGWQPDRNSASVSSSSSSGPAHLLLDRLLVVVEKPHPWYAPSVVNSADLYARFPASLRAGGSGGARDLSSSDPVGNGQVRGGLEESSPGYFRWTAGALASASAQSSEITLIYPLHSSASALVLQPPHPVQDNCGSVLSSFHDSKRAAMSVTISVHSFPCRLRFCAGNVSCSTEFNEY